MSSSGRDSSKSANDSNSWMEWTQQLQAYVAWVNSQLKKKNGTRVVEDLRRDMQDGVALVELVEIVASEKLAGVNYEPSSVQEMKDNVERVLQFMAQRRIRMHHTTAKDIVDGNLKSIMRLILALAAHFKPDSVKHSAHRQYQSPGRGGVNVAGIAQAAAAALADARRDVASLGQRVRRPKELRGGDMSPRYYSSSDQLSDSDQSYGSGRVSNVRARPPREGTSPGGSPLTSAQHSPQSSFSGGTPRGQGQYHGQLRKSVSADFDRVAGSGSDREEKLRSPSRESAREAKVWDNLHQEHDDMNSQMIDTKKALLKLQELLLNGQPPDGAESPEELPFEGSTAAERNVVLQSRLQQTTELCNDLREELSKAKNECMQLQGTKAGLQQRLTEQENALLQMKAEMLRIGFTQQNLETERNDLQKKLNERDKHMENLKREIIQRDTFIQKLQSDLDYHRQEQHSATKGLRTQIQDLNNKLLRVGETEASLTARVASQDRKMAKLEGRILHTPNHDGNNSRPSSAKSNYSNGGTDELQVVRDSLRSIRGSFRGADPQHHTIDTLETSIATLMEKLRLSEQTNSQGMTEAQRRVNFDSTGDKRRSPITALQDSPKANQGFPVQQLDHGSEGQASTKVLYFTERTVTPFMRTIPKRLGEIYLRDFKMLFDRPGNYRFHFKALDPEFGTVKEEVTHDDDLVPGWEGKIVAWIEEDTG